MHLQLPLALLCCCEPTCLLRYAKQHNWPLDETDFRPLTSASSPLHPARGGSSRREGQFGAHASASALAGGSFGAAAEDKAAVETADDFCVDHGAHVTGEPKVKARKKKNKGKRDALGDDDVPPAAEVAAAAATLSEMQLSSRARLGFVRPSQRKFDFSVLASDEGEECEGGNE